MSDEKNEPLKYLLDIYKLYHGHINSMFNFFLVASGLIGNVYIQSITRMPQISLYVPVGVGAFGAFLSIIFFLIHRRSRDLLDTVEAGLTKQEKKLFPDDGGFLISTPSRTWFNRHKYQFPITYGAFTAAFLMMALYAAFATPEDGDPTRTRNQTGRMRRRFHVGGQRPSSEPDVQL